MVIGQMIGAVLFCLLLSGCAETVHDNANGAPVKQPGVLKPIEVIEVIPDQNKEPLQIEKVEGVSLDPVIENELLKQKEQQQKPVSGLFQTTLQPVLEAGKLSVLFSIRNISGKDLQISHSSGQKYDIFVCDEQHNEVYKWSVNKAFTEALIMRDLKKDGKLDFSEEWNLKDNRGNPVPPGTYTIVVKMMINLQSGKTAPDELTAKSVIEIKP